MIKLKRFRAVKYIGIIHFWTSLCRNDADFGQRLRRQKFSPVQAERRVIVLLFNTRFLINLPSYLL